MPIKIQGLSFANYRGAELLSRIRVADFRVKPRTFGIFRIKSVNEAALRQVQFDFYQLEEQQEESEELSLGKQLSDSVQGLAGLQGVGRITQVVMDGMEMKVFGDQHLHFQARAKRATMDISNKGTRLDKVTMMGVPSGKRLVCSVAFWDDEAQTFRIPGEYRLFSPQGRTSGANVAVDLDFGITKLATTQ